MIFVDTGAFLGLFRANDQHHVRAREIWRDIDEPLLTTNLVVAEALTLLGRRVGASEAVKRGSDLYGSSALDIVASTRADELEALNWLRKYADQGVGFTDCVSFAIMKRRRVRTAFTFDRHFRLAGFDVVG